MIPWPEKLRELYPLPPVPHEHWGRREYPRLVHERPWWSFPDIVRSVDGIEHAKTVATRSDGERVVQLDKRILISQGRVAGSKFQRTVPCKGSWQAERASLAEEIDRMFPLQHPGFRVGQVWGNGDGDATTITSILTLKTRQIICGSGLILEQALTLHHPFLIHDAVCPWLSPWSPPEKS